MDFIWESFVMILAGLLLIRVSGRKSIAQMSIATTVVMISIGAILVQPIVEKSVLKTIGAITIFVITLLIIELLQMKFDIVETILKGKAVVVVENGVVNVKNLKKMRLTVDSLEMQLRQKGVDDMRNIKKATFEANGQIGYELFPDAKPLTVGEFKKIVAGMGFILPIEQPETAKSQNTNMFDEVKLKKHVPDIPKDLH